MAATNTDQKERFRQHDIPAVFLSFDLEMNQPSGKIIQIGAVAGNVLTGEIADERFSVLVQCGEPLCTTNNRLTNECDIPRLTGITQEELEAHGVSLWEAYELFVDSWRRRGAAQTLLTWGFGDVRELRSQLLLARPELTDFPAERPFPFGHRSIDVKTLHQAWATVNRVSIKAGLSKALSKHKLTFDGRAHNALWDAYNTFRIAHLLFLKMKEPSA